MNDDGLPEYAKQAGYKMTTPAKPMTLEELAPILEFARNTIMWPENRNSEMAAALLSEHARANAAQAERDEARRLLDAAKSVVSAAETFIAADINVHPMMTREEAVKSGYHKLEVEVNYWLGLQPACQAAAKAKE